jgi:hypothetical protein
MTQTDKAAPPPKRGKRVFLEPQTYRRRRLMDGARILPALGLLLWMVPVLWPTGSSPETELVMLSNAMLYIFLVWLGLILVAVGIWIKARGVLEDEIDPQDEPFPLTPAHMDEDS